MAANELSVNVNSERLRVWWFWCPHLDTAVKLRDLVPAEGTALFEITMKARPVIVLKELASGNFRGVKLFSEKQQSWKNTQHVRIGDILENGIVSYLDPFPQSFHAKLKARDKVVILNDRLVVTAILGEIKEALKHDAARR